MRGGRGIMRALGSSCMRVCEGRGDGWMWEGRVAGPSKSPASLLTSPAGHGWADHTRGAKSGDALTPTPARFPKFVPRPSASSPCPRPAHTPRAHASKHAFTQTKNSLSSLPRHSETLARQPVSRDFRAGGGGKGGLSPLRPCTSPTREARRARACRPHVEQSLRFLGPLRP